MARRSGWEPGTPVVYTVDNLGVTEVPLATQLVPEVVVSAGDTGTYVRPIAVEMRSPRWHLTKVVIGGREFYVPVHESMFELRVTR